jgi:hypothetical protein
VEFVLPLKEMTVAEKLQLMEVLRDDLSRDPENIPSYPWHADILAARQRQIDEGQAKFLPFDEVRRDIEEKIKKCET